MACKYYHADQNFVGQIGVCWGTKERDPCSCGGNGANCDFYDYVRDSVKKLTTSMTPQSGTKLERYTQEEIEAAIDLMERMATADYPRNSKWEWDDVAQYLSWISDLMKQAKAVWNARIERNKYDGTQNDHAE